MSRTFLIDAGERAAKTFAYTLVAFFGVGDGFDAFHADWGNALSMAVGATILSALGSVASMKIGVSGTASVTDVVEPAGRHAAPQV